MLAFRQNMDRREKRFLSWEALVAGLVVLFALGGTYLFMRPKPVPAVETAPDPQPLSEWVNPAVVWDEAAGEAEEAEKPIEELLDMPPLPPPPAPSMDRMKYKGCVADGFLSGYGDDINSAIALVNRSECYYLHRALETWLKPPDFKLARKILSKIERKDVVYGMFIAEAISTNADYYFPAEEREFDFKEMCRNGTKNDWGEHTCKPSFERPEYRKYLKYITERAMDMGIQSFLFGQIFYQEKSDLNQAIIPDIIQGMREYAEFRGMEIVIGAQTNDIVDPVYLANFDFIEGGVGIDSVGEVQDNPCHSRWWQEPGDWCWALLWHPTYKDKAKNVFVHFDWSGKIGDDMSVFTRMSQDRRASTMRRLHDRFRRERVGFLLPLMATLHRENNGCYGPKKRYYSAHRKYSCQDEDAINDILKK
ncbi:MAG: hypothetical protein WBP40_04660 [Candidatus Moraniibacteriota bacterium]